MPHSSGFDPTPTLGLVPDSEPTFVAARSAGNAADPDVLHFARDIPSTVSAELTAWALSGATPRQGMVDAARIDAEQVDSALLPAGLSTEGKAWLRADVQRWLQFVTEVAGARSLKFFFGPILDARCPKFHVDYVRYRLIATYVGPGTEWLPEAAVHRPALVHPPVESDAANLAIVRNPAEIRRAKAGDVLVLRGATEGPGAVHRSPPLGPCDKVRVVLIATVP